MKLKYVLYNIMTGGEGRADPIAEVLLAQQPDVVAIVEAVTTRNEDAPLRRLGRRLHMEWVQATAHDDPTNAVALLSRYPVVESVNLSCNLRFRRPLLYANLRTPGGNVPIAVGHNTDGSDWRSVPRVDVVAGTFDSPPMLQGFDKSLDTLTFPTQQPTKSVDHIWVAKPGRILSVRAETDRLATYASDHYPLVAELEISPDKNADRSQLA
jgi:endonuclease/exonuclease/phosphatase family metal-dependent hydrolase